MDGAMGHVPNRRMVAVLLAVTLTACGGGGDATRSGGEPAPSVGPSSPTLDLLALAPGFFALGNDRADVPPVVSRDGRVVAYAQQDAEPFTYHRPGDPPGLLRDAAIYCSRATAWRDAGPPALLGDDPGCPFPEPAEPGVWYGSSWPAALSGDGEVALVNHQIAIPGGAVSRFAFVDVAGPELVDWQSPHPDGDRPPEVRANDMTPDGALVVGTGWLEYPHPAFSPSDGRPWVFRRGDDGPTWLPSSSDRIESADLVSDHGGVIVGCCEEDRAANVSLPVVWHRDAAPVALRPPAGVDPSCFAHDLSGDGRVAVGRCSAAAVRWVDGEPSIIDVPARDPSPGDVVAFEARQTSFDGSVVLGGTFGSAGPPGGWLWTEASGVRAVHDVLREAGFEPDGVAPARRLHAALAFARDGKVLVGFGEGAVGATYAFFLYRLSLP